MTTEILLALTFFTGVVIECLFLINKKPTKYSYIIFIGMFLYMLAISAYSIFSTHYVGTNLNQIVSAQIFSMAFVFGFLFIAIFLKEVVKIINEVTLFSLTITFWFLIYNALINGHSFTPALIIIGIFGTTITGYLAYHQQKPPQILKLFSYGWFLFINAFLAFYFFLNTKGIFTLTATTPAEASFIQTFLAGLITTYLIMNAGLLYYGTIYYMMSLDARKVIKKHSDLIFTDKQITKQEIKAISITQIVTFTGINWLKPLLSITVITAWTLLLPIAYKLYTALRSK